jgi:hypothetical protein
MVHSSGTPTTKPIRRRTTPSTIIVTSTVCAQTGVKWTFPVDATLSLASTISG